VPRALTTEPERRLKTIEQTPQVSRSKRLSIYGDAYFLRIIDCLGFNFPTLKNVLGETDFFTLAKEYLTRYPSTFRSIDDVGHRFYAFLKTHRFTKKRPYLSDLAVLEWAVHTAFYANDVPSSIDKRTFKKIPPSAWEKARFHFDPSVRLLNLSYSVDNLWRGHGRALRQRTPLLVYRQDDKLVRAPRIDVPQFKTLALLLKGKKLGEALRGVRKAAAVQKWFGEWMQRGIIRRIDTSLRGS
jgi:hypothetical protein